MQNYHSSILKNFEKIKQYHERIADSLDSLEQIKTYYESTVLLYQKQIYYLVKQIKLIEEILNYTSLEQFNDNFIDTIKTTKHDYTEIEKILTIINSSKKMVQTNNNLTLLGEKENNKQLNSEFIIKDILDKLYAANITKINRANLASLIISNYPDLLLVETILMKLLQQDEIEEKWFPLDPGLHIWTSERNLTYSHYKTIENQPYIANQNYQQFYKKAEETKFLEKTYKTDDNQRKKSTKFSEINNTMEKPVSNNLMPVSNNLMSKMPLESKTSQTDATRSVSSFIKEHLLQIYPESASVQTIIKTLKERIDWFTEKQLENNIRAALSQNKNKKLQNQDWERVGYGQYRAIKNS